MDILDLKNVFKLATELVEPYRGGLSVASGLVIKPVALTTKKLAVKLQWRF